MHGNLDAVARTHGLPRSIAVARVAGETRGAAADVLLTYPDGIVRCSASALLPRPYGLRGGYLAVFGDAAIEWSWTGGWDGRPTGTLIEYTEAASREVALPAVDTYSAVIDHVFECLAGRAASRLSPASVLASLQLTLEIRDRLTAPAGA
jgi:hypothetical protein